MTHICWKDIPGYEGYYQASRDGEIRSVKRTVVDYHNGKKRRRVFKSRILRHRVDPSSLRRSVMLSVHGETKRLSVHRLVCLAFHGQPPSGKTCVLHWDDNPTNNAASNLRWGSHTENVADQKRNHGGQLPNFIDGRSKRSVRNTESRGNPILEPHQVRMIRKLGDMRKRRGLRTKLAKLWGVHPSTITSARTKAWAEPHKPKIPA